MAPETFHFAFAQGIRRKGRVTRQDRLGDQVWACLPMQGLDFGQACGYAKRALNLCASRRSVWDRSRCPLRCCRRCTVRHEVA